MFDELVDNVEAQQKFLAAVSGRNTLTRLLSPTGAYALGVIPLARETDGIVFASYPHPCRGVETVLRRHFQRDVHLVPFDENVMSFFLNKIYLKQKGVNLHTFPKPDFLDDPTCHTRLFEPKIESPSSAGSTLPGEFVALADIHLASTMQNLERSEPPRLENYRLGEFSPAFRKKGKTWMVWSSAPLPPEASMLVQFTEDYGGEEFFRDLSAYQVTEWPVILFPSEVQLLSLSRLGALEVYVDGKLGVVKSGDTLSMKTEYYLVRHGQRVKRTIALDVKEFIVVKREGLEYAPPFKGAGAEELGKWLGTGR